MIKITDLPTIALLENNDVIPVVDISGDVTSKITFAALRTALYTSAGGALAIQAGGTGAITAEDARINLGAAAVGHTHTASNVGADPQGTATAIMLSHVNAPDPHAQYTTEAEVYDALGTHTSRIDNPHSTTATQVGADATGTANTLLAAHSAASNPHSQYMTNAQVAVLYAPLSHGHIISNITNLQTTLDAKTNIGHSHAIADISGLQTALDSKSLLGHSHGIDDVIGLRAGIDAKTNIGHSHTIADTTLLQTTLDNKAALIHNHTISSVTGLVTELSNKTNVGHAHVITDTTLLQTTLDAKAPMIHNHVVANITGLQTTLDSKSNTGHGHYTSDIEDLDLLLTGKSNVDHIHVITDVANLAGALANRSLINHTHAYEPVIGNPPVDGYVLTSTRAGVRIWTAGGGTAGGGGETVTQTERMIVRTLRTRCGVIIPMYVYPSNIYNNTAWNGLIDLLRVYSTVPTVVIVNPGSGPGITVDGNYTAAIQRISATGALCAGYVSTAYGARSSADVIADLVAWQLNYPEVSAIFWDEMSATDTPEAVAYYVDITTVARSMGFSLVIGNPGTDLPTRYYQDDVADNMLVWETGTYPTEAWLKGDFAGGRADFDKRRNGILVHSQAYDTTFVAMAQKYSGLLYITPDTMPNPWDTVSSDLKRLFQDLEQSAILPVQDTRNTNVSPAGYLAQCMQTEFKSRTVIGLGGTDTFCGVLTIKPWYDASGGRATQLAFSDLGLSIRQADNDASVWGAWGTVALAGHTHSYEPLLGNPDVDGKVLSSTTLGVRSWVTPASTIANIAGLQAALDAKASSTHTHGTVIFSMIAPTSVAAGTAAIGGGVGRFAVSMAVGAIGSGTANVYQFNQSLSGLIAVGPDLSTKGSWRVRVSNSDSSIYSDIASFGEGGEYATFYGTAPPSVAANTAAIGGGHGLFANSITAQSVKITGTQILVNGVDADIAFNINYVGYNMGTTRFRSTNIYDGKNGLIARFDGATSKVTINSTSDGSLTANGRITAKAAVPASFADLAAVRTYLASILT